MTYKPIKIVPYDPAWPKIFENEAAAIRTALGTNCVALYHIGSTAVPGLLAKPKIDMMAVVRDPGKVAPELDKIGILYRGEYNIPLHYGFSKRGEVDINLHVYEEGHPEIELNLLFRDYLRENQQAREEYENLKKGLLLDQSPYLKNKFGFTNYTLRKGDFIRKILKQAGWDQIRMMKCNDDTEWAAARYFRQTYFFKPHNLEDPYAWTFTDPAHQHFVLYQGVEIIGYAHIQLWQDLRAAIRIIVIEDVKRNNNFGSKLLTWCERWLKSQNYKSIHAESRPTSVAFYKKKWVYPYAL